MTFRIIQINRTSSLVSTHVTDEHGQPAMRRMKCEPGRVIAEHNERATAEKHLAKIRRKHPAIEAEIAEWAEVAL
jgi:hypothetical protein